MAARKATDDEIKTPRQAAKDAGELYYWTGKPCKHGHVAMRQTSSGGCVECTKAMNARPEMIEKKRAAINAHYQRNKEDRLKYGKEYRQKNREKFTQWMADWRKANPERDKANKRASQAKRRASMRGMSNKEFIEWTASQPKICHWCGVRCADSYHVDHYEPLARGGRHEASNLVIACKFCNLSKKAKDPYEFAAAVGRLF